MSAICRKSWPSMPATSTAGAHTVRLDNVRPARRCHLRRIDAPKLEGSSQHPCSEVFIMFMSGPHDRPIQFLRPTGRIVFTSSEVHDPDAFCLMGITRATWQDPLVLADAERSQNHIASPVDRGEARYCASKLLILMYVRHLARALPDVGVLAFNPSVVPGTEIALDRNRLQQLGWKYVLPLLTPLLPGTRSLKTSASDLLWLMTEADGQCLSGHYVDGRVAQPGSAESRDEAKIARVVEVGRSLLATTRRRQTDPGLRLEAQRRTLSFGEHVRVDQGQDPRLARSP